MLEFFVPWKNCQEIIDANFFIVVADDIVQYVPNISCPQVHSVKPHVERLWKIMNHPNHDSRAIELCILDELKYDMVNETPQKLSAQSMMEYL